MNDLTTNSVSTLKRHILSNGSVTVKELSDSTGVAAPAVRAFLLGNAQYFTKTTKVDPTVKRTRGRAPDLWTLNDAGRAAFQTVSAASEPSSETVEPEAAQA